MDAIELLTTRASAILLKEPGPDEAAIARMLAAAARAPDHGRLRPWRFILVRGAARERLGEVWEQALRRRDPGLPEVAYERERAKPLRAPLVIAVVAKAQPDHPKIPEVEQVLSAGCAAYAIMLAAKAEGFGAMWKTGDAAYDEGVKHAFGLEPWDHIVSFLHIGTLEAETPQTVKRPHYSALTEEWAGPLVPVAE